MFVTKLESDTNEKLLIPNQIGPSDSKRCTGEIWFGLSIYQETYGIKNALSTSYLAPT